MKSLVNCSPFHVVHTVGFHLDSQINCKLNLSSLHYIEQKQDELHFADLKKSQPRRIFTPH